MILDGFLKVFLAGCIGGFCGDFLGWWKLRTCDPQEFPKYLKYYYYWILTFLMWVVGGLCAIAYGTKEVHVILAIHLGISAPLIIQKLSSIMPRVVTDI